MPESPGAPERVLGLDLAMGTTGWCLLVRGRPAAHGVFHLPDRRRNEPLAEWMGRRAAALAEQVRLLLGLHRPAVVAFEYPDTYRRAWSGGTKGREFEVSQALGRVQGFLVAAWPQIGGDARLVAVSTSEAKRTVTGRVTANKDQVRLHLALDYRWDLDGWSDDETDAGAVALAALQEVR
jgi:Holliday junction resolvasome RuvABC endonuclease subunit